MGLRGKIAGLFVIGFGVMTLFALTQHHKALQNNFLSIEQRLAAIQLRQLSNSLNNELDTLNQASYDWSNWDEAYAYMQHPSSEFTDKQISPAALKNIGVRFLAMLDTQGNTVFAQAVDLQSGGAASSGAFDGTLADIKRRLAAPDTGRPCGLTMAHDGPVLACWQPIRKTTANASPIGTLVMERALDSALLGRLQVQDNIKFELTPLAIHDAQARTPPTDQIEFEPVIAAMPDSGDLVAVTRNLLGEQILKVRLEPPHEISLAGSEFSWKELLRMAGLAFLVGLILFLCLNFMIFGRLNRMSLELKSIWRNGRWAERLATSRRSDEIGDLAHAINRMLGLIRKQTQALDNIAHTDSLTQIANRRAFEQRILIEVSLHKRNRSPLSLLWIDIDHFKLYNDMYGYPAGDEILVQIAKLLTQVACRPSDLPARIAEEEFAVILPSTSLDGAVHVAETLKNKLAQMQIPHANSPVSETITLSIGVTAAGDEDLAALMYRVEQAHTQARETGRNRICAIAPAAKEN